MGHVGDQITSILMAIIGVAILSVILSRRSNTVSVIGSAANAFSMALGTAVSPITGNNSLGPVGGFTGFGGGGSFNYDSPGSLNF